MRWEYAESVMGPCTYPAKHTLHLSNIGKNQTSEIVHVCGIHKNSILRHSNQVGFAVNVQPNNQN